jgi:hypothetical protein
MIIYVLTEEDGAIIGWGSTNGMEEEIEVEIDDNHPFLNDLPFNYKLINGQIIKDDDLSLRTEKQMKDIELNRACQEAILAGFTHIVNGVTYWFSYDYEAQGNFRDAREVLNDGIVDEIMWTVREDGQYGNYTRIPITLDIMHELTVVIMQHKTDKISKYRDFLMPLVKEATTIEELEAIKW